MKSTLFLALIASAVSITSVRAEEKSWPTITLSSYVANQYLGFETGNPLSSDPVIQSDIFVSFANGIYADLAVSRSLKGSWDDGSFGNEVDYAVGWKGQITENLSLKVGITYFDEPKALSLGRGDILHPVVYLTRSFTNFAVTAGYENFTPLPGSGFEGGHLFSMGVSTSKNFCQEKVGTHASALLVYDTGTIGSGRGFFWRGNLGLDWHANKHLTVNVFGMNWYVPMMSDKRSTDAMIWSGVSYKFN